VGYFSHAVFLGREGLQYTITATNTVSSGGRQCPRLNKEAEGIAIAHAHNVFTVFKSPSGPLVAEIAVIYSCKISAAADILPSLLPIVPRSWRSGENSSSKQAASTR
jgi:hypothetical protein